MEGNSGYYYLLFKFPIKENLHSDRLWLVFLHSSFSEEKVFLTTMLHFQNIVKWG